MSRLISLLIVFTVLLSSCNSDNDVPISEEPVFIFPENLKGEWINEDLKWGFRLIEPGVIEFIALDTELDQYVNYLDEVDSIFFLDSTRFIFRPTNCFYSSVFEEYLPVDTGYYHLNHDSLSLELVQFLENESISIVFIKNSIEIPEDNSYMNATINIEGKSYEFKSNGLINNYVGFNHIDSLDQLIIYSESTNIDCILLSRISSFEILLGIQEYHGIGVYPIIELNRDLTYEDPSWLIQWNADVGNQFLLSGSIEIIEHSATRLKGKFSVDLIQEDDTLGTLDNGFFEIYN